VAAQALRPYQRQAIDEAKQAYRDGKRAILLVAPTGAGKTLLGCEIVKGAIAKGNNVLWLAHRAELLTQARDRLLANGVERVGIIASGQRVVNANVQVASIQTLAARLRHGLPPASVVVFDECVTGDTMVGNVRADAVKVGDVVPSWDGVAVVNRRVVHVFSNQPRALITLHVSGKALRCTSNHPIWIEGREYVRADEVREGDLCRVWSADEGVPQGERGEVLRDGMQTEGQASGAGNVLRLRRPDSVDVRAGVAKDVQQDVRECQSRGNDDCHQPSTRIGTHARLESDGRSGDAGKGVGATSGNRSPADGSGRDGPGDVGGADVIARRSRRRMGRGTSDRDGGARTGEAVALHDRHCAPVDEDSDRGGRVRAQVNEGEDPGRGEGRLSRLARVDRIEVHESTSDGTFGGLCPGGVVYNFEVEGEHNYFANGILTHNCHHFVADEWGAVAAAYKGSAILGLTATPQRGDGKPLGDLFDHLVPVSSVKELQATIDPVSGRAVLVPCVIWRPSSKTKTLSQDPVAAYLSRAPGERAFVFCANVKHAEATARSFVENGVPAATIHADTPWLLRRARVEAFRSQSTAPLLAVGSLEPAPLALCNVYCLTEGVDVPEASVCIIARGCGHVGMYLQMVGRVLRSAAGKERAILIDLRGVSHKHKPPEFDRTWSLDGDPCALAESEKDVKAIECKECGAEFGGWRISPDGSRSCPSCGAEAPAQQLPAIALRELHAAGSGADEGAKLAALESLALQAVAQKFQPGWVAHAFRERFGDWPDRRDSQRALNFARGAT
jgi:DNA repair protein RadD